MATRRAPAKKGTVRTRTAAPSISVAPRILSEEEKHQLILAHARARKPVDPGQRVSLWVGVALCLLFIVGGWWFTLKSGISRTMAGPPDPTLTQSAELTSDFLKGSAEQTEETGNTLQEALHNVTSRLELTSSDPVLDQLTAQITASSTATSTPLFKPSSTSNTTSTH